METVTPPFAASFECHPPLSAAEAVVEAEACLQCGGPASPPPCVTACPAAIDVPGFILDIAKKRPLDAAHKIFSENVLGGSCARVCPVEVLCEGACVLKKEGRHPIQIARLQRFATDRAFEQGREVASIPRTAARQPADIAVIGAGPAGLACAAELARLGYIVTVYESREAPGGLVSYGIAPYKQQIDPIPQEVDRIRRLGVEFRFGVTVGRDIPANEIRATHSAVFLGVGMGEDLPARIPGENLPGVWESLSFVEQLKKGPRSALRIGKRVAVIGGGNTAIDVAREAVMLDARDVMMLYRRTEAQMPAYAHEIAAAKSEGVQILELVMPTQFVGDRRVRAVRCQRMQLGAPDASGRPRPEPIPDSEFEIEVDSVITAIGQKPRTDFFRLFEVDVQNGVVPVADNYQTSVPGCFAGGDCLNGGATVVDAVRDGKLAAHGIDRWLTGRTPPPAFHKPPARSVHLNGTIANYQMDSRLMTSPLLCKGCNICVTSCPTHTLRLDESNRIAVIDVNECVFCGLCEARCPDFAIWTERGSSGRARPASAVSEVSV